MTEEIPLPLGGELDPNEWYFKLGAEEGPLPNPVGHTFPLLTHDPEGRWSLVGTGFYISSDGLFVTARHVIEEVLRDRRQVSPLVILHLRSDTGLFGPSDVLFRPISQCWLHDNDRIDIALGVAATCTNIETGQILQHWCWPLSWEAPSIGAGIATYAFPRHNISADGSFIFQPELYPGAVLATGNYRDRVMIPFPYIEVDCRIHGAASGGPIVANAARVVGVNCTEWPINIDHPPGPGFGVQIQCLSEAFIGGATLAGEKVPRRVTFDELVRAGSIDISGYVARGPAEPSSGFLVRLDEILALAERPQISVIQYV